MPILVLTLTGTDHAGVLAAVSQVINQRGGSWERSQVTQLDGYFAGIIEVEVPSQEEATLVADIEGLSAQGMRVAVEHPVESAPVAEGIDRATVRFVGADHPGIVAEVSALLADHQVNVEELSTRVVDAPMAGGYLFEAEAVVSVPESTDSGVLRVALEALANELMVDLEWHEDA